MKIGVITDCFKSTPEQGIKRAAQLGLSGVQIYAVGGGFSPQELSASQKADYKRLLEEHGIKISALCGDMGGFGFEREQDNPERIEKTKRIIDLASEFGAPVVTTHIGVIPADKSDPRYGVMLSALSECGAYGKTLGVTLAVETGPERAPVLRGFIEDAGGAIGVNLDPANFVMVSGQDPVEAVYLLRDYIVHVHAKDGVRHDENLDPTAVYHAFAVGGVEALEACKGFSETPLGDGAVDWRAFIAALRDIGYDGFLTIERETGDDPDADISRAAKYLSRLLEE